MEPSFFLSYWRPWDEESSLIDGWGDYLRDTSLVDYGTKKISSFIQQASRDNVRAIEEASRKQAKATIASGMLQVKAIQDAANKIGFKLDNVSNDLKFLNRRMDIAIEQQRAEILLQNNIAELLKISDSEKERQEAITLGIQFFHNASFDSDLYDDALEEFLRAERLKRQDFFVLHRIGCIYLFVEKHFDIPKALDYFVRAGKYASIESDPGAIRLANLLTNPVKKSYSKATSDIDSIRNLAGDSYEKAALASYIIGDFTNAIVYQNKALKLFDRSHQPENRFKLAKYLIRDGNINDAIKELVNTFSIKPELIEAVFCDVDMLANPSILEAVHNQIREVNLALHDLLEDFLDRGWSPDSKIVKDLFDSDSLSYVDKVHLRNRAMVTKANT